MGEDIRPNKMIAVYARVSTSNQENEGTIETQLSAVRDYAKKNGFTIVQEYLDNGWSGDNLMRPALDQLRMDAKKKIWEAILMYDPDRLARRYSYQELVIDELRELGIELLFVTVPTPKNSEDKILHGVRGLFAEYERAKISERFRLGKLRKVKEGHILISEPAYGYQYIRKRENQHGYYVIDEEEARVVRLIFQWVGEDGLTIRQLVAKLRELNIKPRKSKRGIWNTSTLSKLLRNRVYIGEAHWGSTYAVEPNHPLKHEKYKKMRKSSRRTKPEAEWIASKIPVPPIISKTLFVKARKQLETNFALCQRNKKNEYLLAGKIRCICGRTRTGEGLFRGKHLYYRCSDRVLSYPLPPNCKERGINARIADKLVWDKVAQLMSSPELMRKQYIRWITSRQGRVKSSVEDLITLEKGIAKIKEQQDRYNKAYGAGLLTIEQLKSYATPLREKLTLLEAQIVQAKENEKRSTENLMPNEAEVKDFIGNSVKMLKNLGFKQKRFIVINVIEQIIGTQQNLEVRGYLPILSSNYVEFKTNGRNCRSAQCG